YFDIGVSFLEEASPQGLLPELLFRKGYATFLPFTQLLELTPESYDRIIRDENELLEKINYMFENPLKRGVAEDPWNYPGWYLTPNQETV
ncbi:MAG: hypothetical protein WBP29_03965, partial [Candidatus Zixiibacteriota bacterium]